jgi:hypothetical protein
MTTRFKLAPIRESSILRPRRVPDRSSGKNRRRRVCSELGFRACTQNLGRCRAPFGTIRQRKNYRSDRPPSPLPRAWPANPRRNRHCRLRLISFGSTSTGAGKACTTRSLVTGLRSARAETRREPGSKTERLVPTLPAGWPASKRAFGPYDQPAARFLRGVALRSKNSAWLMSPETVDF